ncbi:hypothetical protein WMF45_03550 [Sorangium sp. So ce448]|uniref:hypothetical protein n=1 Tax=Sorangium sp. So ce448 TaxID=3133314 RepID=UPI003F6259DA
MGSNKDSDDIRQYLPDLESIRREADPEVAERKLRQAQNNPELDRALSEMQQQKPTGQPLFQFPVVPAVAKERTGPPPMPVQAVPPPFPVQGRPPMPAHGGPPPMPVQGGPMPVQGGPPPFSATAPQQAVPHGAVAHQQVHPHGAAALPGAAVPHQGAMATPRAPVAHQGATPPQRVPVHGAPMQQGALVTQRVPVFGGAAAPERAPAQQQSAPAQQQGAPAPSQWADRGLPPIDKSLLPSSLLPVTPPPVAVSKEPVVTPATGQRRQWMPTWLMVVLAIIAVSSPFVLSMILKRAAPPKEQEPALPPSGAPVQSATAPPAVSDLLPPAAPAPPEAVEPSLDDTAPPSEPPVPPLEAIAPQVPPPQAPARPVRPAPHRPLTPTPTPAAPAPTPEKQLADDVME